MKTSAQKSLELSRGVLSSIKEKVLANDSDVVIFGVDDSNTSVVLQLILAKLASELGYEIILPYDIGKIISLEEDVASGKNVTFEQLLFQAILSSGVSYSPAYAFVKSVDAKISMIMKDREFGVAWAKRKKILDTEDEHIAGVCESKLHLGKRVICIVSTENMLGVKKALEKEHSVQELSLLPEAKQEEDKNVEPDDFAKGAACSVEDDERERVVESEPYTGGVDFSEHRGAVPSIDGNDNVSRQMEKALSSSNIEDKIARLEDLCLAIDKKHSVPGGRRIHTYWFDAANVVKRKRYFLQLADNIDINVIHELSRIIYLNFNSIFCSICSSADTLILSEDSDIDIDFMSKEVASLHRVVIHSDFLGMVGKRLLGEEQEEYICRLTSFLKEKGVNELVLDFSTSREIIDDEVSIARAIISKAKADDDLRDLSIETIGADKLDINIPKVFSSTINVTEIAKWLEVAKLDDRHPLFLLKPIDFLFLLKDTALPSVDLVIGLECVKARIKELRDDLYGRRYEFRKGFPSLIKDRITSLSSSCDAQNYVFELLGVNLRILEDSSMEREQSITSADTLQLHSLYLRNCYSEEQDVASSRLHIPSSLLKLH